MEFELYFSYKRIRALFLVCNEASEGSSLANEGKHKVITGVQVVLAVLVAVGAAWLVFKLAGYAQARSVYSGIESAYAADVRSEQAGGTCPIDFAALREQCPTVVAWIQMDDCDVSYPIVQGADNDFYLEHDAAGDASVSGSVFLDYRNKSIDDDIHSIVYAHNMRDESMFGPLDQYVEEAFYRSGTGCFTVHTPEAAYRYQIFAVNIVDPTDDTYTVGFKKSAVFDPFVKKLKAQSMYDTGVEVSGTDRVMTLSTCSANDRLVLCAKRIEETPWAA